MRPFDHQQPNKQASGVKTGNKNELRGTGIAGQPKTNTQHKRQEHAQEGILVEEIHEDKNNIFPEKATP